MLSLLLAFAIASGPGTSQTSALAAEPAAMSPDSSLMCSVAGDKGPRRCKVGIPKGRAVRACAAADERAHHCAVRKGRKYVAWTVASGGAHCKISKKRTDWKKAVTVSMSKETAKPGAACELHVGLR